MLGNLEKMQKKIKKFHFRFLLYIIEILQTLLLIKCLEGQMTHFVFSLWADNLS